jgi:phosphate transport system substrate-binding protein
VRSWSQVPGAKASGPIDIIARTAASGTQDAFQNIFMGLNLRVSPSASVKSSNGLQAQAVKSNPNAIGYASFNFTKGLWDIPYKGVGCSLRNAKSGQYLGSRNFWMVTRGAPTGAAKAWIRWIRDSATARGIVSSSWVPQPRRREDSRRLVERPHPGRTIASSACSARLPVGCWS